MSTLRERIVGRIGELREKHSQAVFWKQTFDDLGSSEEVEGALRAMCDAGELRAYLGVYSEGGHLCWLGAEENFRPEAPFYCGECSERYDPETHQGELRYMLGRGLT